MTNAPPPLTTSFDEHSTAEEVLADVDLSGRRAIVTGASSGIGTETARVLALRGAAVTLTARDLAAGETAAAQIRQSTGSRAVDVLPLELADRPR
jgi:short-subunit dehydrogenase